MTHPVKELDSLLSVLFKSLGLRASPFPSLRVSVSSSLQLKA